MRILIGGSSVISIILSFVILSVLFSANFSSLNGSSDRAIGANL